MTQPHAKVGRKPKYTPETLERIITAIKVGASYEDAANFGGIDYSTFFRWMQQGEKQHSGELCEFRKAIKKAESEACLKWLTKIEQAANEGDWHAAAWKLERRKPEEYARRAPQQVNVSGTIEQHHSGHITLEELQKLDEKTPARLDDWKAQRGFAGRGKERLA